MFGVRGAPGNSINHATSYWVGNHSKRVFGDSVDIVSGIGWDKVDPQNPAYRFTNVFRVVTNLGVFDFDGPDHQMRALSLHPGVDAEQVPAMLDLIAAADLELLGFHVFAGSQNLRANIISEALWLVTRWGVRDRVRRLRRLR